MPSSHLILHRPLLLLPPTPPSIRVFSSESVLRMRWPKYWSFSFSISPSNEHPGLISFGMDWLDLLAVQGTLESSPTPQFKSINFSVLSFPHSPTLTSIHDHWSGMTRVPNAIQMLFKCCQCNKFKFCFLEISETFVSNIFYLRLVEFTDAEPANVENQLYLSVLGYK